MSETTAEYRKAMRFQYSKQGTDVGVVGILDELEQAYADVERLERERDAAVERLQREHSRPGSSHVPPLPGRTDYACDICRFLSTDTPECERVFAGCGVAGIGYKCVTHHGPWPSGTMRCPAAMTVNVTT